MVSLSNDFRNSLLMTCYYPDLGSDASSVPNFCARFSDVILRGNHSGSIAKCQLFSQVINPQERSKIFLKKPSVVFVSYTVLLQRFHFNAHYTGVHPLKKERETFNMQATFSLN